MRTKILSTIVFFLFLTSVGFGQMKSGVDIYSRYIWRGSNLGNSPSFQPSLSYTTGGFSVGAWGSYSTIGSYSEDDLWATYSFALPSGSITASLTDYYIPAFLSPTATFFNYNTKKGLGSHTVEIGLAYAGGESMPLSIAVYYDAIGGVPDPDNSTYIQASYPVMSDLSVTVGLTPSKSTVWYTTAKAGLINVGLATTKTIKVTESFSIPFNVQYIMNPYAEAAYLIFGISL